VLPAPRPHDEDEEVALKYTRAKDRAKITPVYAGRLPHIVAAGYCDARSESSSKSEPNIAIFSIAPIVAEAVLVKIGSASNLCSQSDTPRQYPLYYLHRCDFHIHLLHIHLVVFRMGAEHLMNAPQAVGVTPAARSAAFNM
jgi:hypothetical protein